MKKTTNYQRATQYLVKIFKAVNEEYFDNELEMPTITIQSTVGAYGHVSVSKIWHNNEYASHELNLSADYLARPIEDLVTTMIHEACHLYAMQKGIKDTSNRGVYHNKHFKELAEERGLCVEQYGKYGWTSTKPTEETIDFCVKYGFEDVQISRGSHYSFGKNGDESGKNSDDGNLGKRKPTSTRKYICPCCKNSFRATKNLNVKCMDCNQQFIIAG